MTCDLVDEFFSNEFDDHVRVLVKQLLDSPQAGELTLNIFNVRFDPALHAVTLVDELDPSRIVELDASRFARLVDEA